MMMAKDWTMRKQIIAGVIAVGILGVSVIGVMCYIVHELRDIEAEARVARYFGTSEYTSYLQKIERSVATIEDDIEAIESEIIHINSSVCTTEHDIKAIKSEINNIGSSVSDIRSYNRTLHLP